MNDFGARIFISIMLMLPMACSNQGAQPDRLDEMDVYAVELPQKSSSVREAASAGETIEESNVSSIEDTELAQSSPQVKPAIILDQTYTIQIGVFDNAKNASSFVSSNKLVAEDAGIALVTLEGEKKFLLAYGIYSSVSEAQSAADQFSSRMQSPQREVPFKVVTLAAIKAISETVNANSDILEISAF